MGRELHVHSHLSRVEHWRHLVEIVALIIAAAWAFYVFVYQERIKPASEDPNLQLLRSVTHEPLPHGKELVTITVTMKNIGASPVALGGLIVNTYGIRYNDRSGDSAPKQRASGFVMVNRGLVESKPALLYAYSSLWRPLAGERIFNIPPQETFTIPISFVIHSGVYDTLRVNFARCIQRADNQLASRFVPRRLNDGSFDVLWMMHEAGAHAGLDCSGAAFAGGEFAL